MMCHKGRSPIGKMDLIPVKNHEKLVRLFPVLVTDLTDKETLSNRPGFGGWLRAERENQNLAISELAERAGVTAAIIYDLEAGRSANPQVQTKKRLEKALKSNVSYSERGR